MVRICQVARMWTSQALAQDASTPAGANFLTGILPLVVILVGGWLLFRWLKKKERAPQPQPSAGIPKWLRVRLIGWGIGLGALLLAFSISVPIVSILPLGMVLLFVGFIAVRVWLDRLIVERSLGVAQEHMQTLVRKRYQLLAQDEYGVWQRERWSKHLGYFIGTVVDPRTGGIPERLTARVGLEIDSLIAAESANSSDEDEPMPLDGAEFESYCRRILEKHGWRVTATPVTGDQGVDLVGHLGLAIVAIQCKRYSSSVTNKAVQEVIAGRTHYGAHFAVVVSNAPYTKSATELAKTNVVFLLHPVDLPKLGDIILDALRRAA